MVVEVGTQPAKAKDALAEIYETHVGEVMRLAYLISDDRALAEDVTQEAFIRLSGKLFTLRNPAATKAYLGRIVMNLCREHFRRSKVRQKFLSREMALTRPEHHQSEQYEVRDELWAALSKLSTRQRAAVVLRYYEDLSEAQTAERLGCAVGTVKSLTSRAMQILREEMGGRVQRRASRRNCGKCLMRRLTTSRLRSTEHARSGGCAAAAV